MGKYKKEKLKLQDSGKKRVTGSFDGGLITSDAGGLLLKEIDSGSNILKRFSDCFTDHRNWCEYSVENLISQRVFGLALGYEDLNDHDKLRNDPTLMTLVGNKLAGKSTLNRLELTEADANKHTRYKKIVFDEKKIEDLFIDIFIESFEEEPDEIIIDIDSTDDKIHGKQENSHYNGHYGCYCYLPLYIFSGNFLLSAKLRPSNIDGAFEAKEEIERIVKRIRKIWPDVPILIRGDAGFQREEIFFMVEENGCDYITGLGSNKRLNKIIESSLSQAKAEYEITLKPARVFQPFSYKTLTSWSKERNVVAKAEHLEKGANPRFIVTNLDPIGDGSELYEGIYCKRGEMENRLKEQKLDLFSGRTSSTKFRANQLRVWFSAVAYVLINELRRIALKGTELAKAQCSTIRDKIFKLGASVFNGARQIRFCFSEGYPFAELFTKILKNINEHFD